MSTPPTRRGGRRGRPYGTREAAVARYGRRRILVGAALATALTLTAMAAQERPPQRIISLIPALTEMLFAIGAGPQVAAVSSFDRYPPDVETLPRVGALIDPDLERIISLRPDLVLVYGSQGDLRMQLERAKIPIFLYQHASLADVPVTIRDLGARVGRKDAAERVASDVESGIHAIRMRVAGRTRPRVLTVIGRDSGAVRGVYASGGFGFIHDMVNAAGGDNVFADIHRQAVQATSEHILALGPDVILELRAGALTPQQRAREVAAWAPFSSVPAVRNGRVIIITDQRTIVPGPRVAEGTGLIARALHPEAW